MLGKQYLILRNLKTLGTLGTLPIRETRKDPFKLYKGGHSSILPPSANAMNAVEAAPAPVIGRRRREGALHLGARKKA
jgi:hypothetical protein